MIKQNNYQYSLFFSIIFNVSFRTSTFVWPQRNNIIAAQHSMHNLNLISKQIIWHKFKQFSTTCNFKVLWKKIEPTEGSMSNLQLLTKKFGKTKEVPTSLVHIIWKFVEPNNAQQINFAAPPIQKLTKYLYFVGFLILKSKATAVFGEKFGLTIFHLQSWSLILRYSDPVSFIFM